MKEGVDKKQPVKGPKKMDKIMSTKTLCVNTRRPTQSALLSLPFHFVSLSLFGKTEHLQTHTQLDSISGHIIKTKNEQNKQSGIGFEFNIK